MHDVARHAGVSQTAVSFVINGTPDARIPETTRQRVWQSIRELGYRPNAVAQGLRRGGSQMIGLVSDAIATTPFAGAIIRGAQDAAWADGKILLVVNTDSHPDMEEAAISVMLEHRVLAFVYSSWYHHPVAPPAAIHEVPSILVNCFDETGHLPSVVPDEVQGGRTATEALIRAGHRRIGLLNSSFEVPATPSTVGRPIGYRTALAAAGIQVDEALLLPVTPDQEGGYAGGTAMLDLEHRPSAVFCYNDRVAMGVYTAAAERGLRIPDDLAVVGFDNQEVIAAHLRPPLTTVALPHYEMGWWGVNYLLGDLLRPSETTADAPVRHVIACPLIERASITGA
jgi:LacI family transcriptional regulator